MSDSYSFERIESLLFQCALETRELSQKKNEINHQIKVFRGEIAERKVYIETLQKNIEKLDVDIFQKQSTLKLNKSRALRIKKTNDQLLQYQQTLKEELEIRKANYKDDLVQHEERIANYKKVLQTHKDFYYNSPLAQKLIALQAEKVEIESQLKACDDQITIAQKELDLLTGPVATSLPEKPSASISSMQPATEPDEQLAPQTEEDSVYSIDISSLHFNLSKDGQDTAVDEKMQETCEENKVQDLATDNPVQEAEACSGKKESDQTWTELMQSEEENQETKPEDQVPQSAPLDIEEAVEEEKVEDDEAEETEQALPEGDKERPKAFPQSPAQTHPQTSPATVKATPTTPTFPFNFSPASSPRQGTSDTKSPAFMFSLKSDPSTPGFPGFGFDVGSSQEEDSSFAFMNPFFNEKKTATSKSSSCSEFPFGQQEQSQDFPFAFAAQSPQTTKKENSGDEFPFSFNF